MMFGTKLFVLLTTVAVTQGTLRLLTPRSGFCPSPIGSYLGSCSFKCSSDIKCLFGNRKCCPTLCGGSVCIDSVAVEPVTTTTVAPTTKTGICPAPLFLIREKCFLKPQSANCVKDDDCSGTKKCCTNGCVLTCTAAASPKPGFCPSPLGASYTGACPFNCRTDAYCILSNKKCCPTLCGGNVCVAPVAAEPVTTTTEAPTTKTGTCPAPTYPTKDSCYLTPQVAGCVKDDDCSGTQKCCSNGCVLTCRAALP